MLDVVGQWMPNIVNKIPDFYSAIIETFIMLGVVGSISLFLGIGFGVLLIVTGKQGILETKVVYVIVGKGIDLFRSIPFIILIFLISPFTRMILGTSIGLKGAFLPLIIGATPFVARQIESVLSEVDYGLVEASQAMGSSPLEIIFRVYLRESIPGILRATTITFVTLISFIAMVGAIGGGGIGDFCIRYGYNMRQNDVIYVCIIILLCITSLIQGIGNFIVKKTTH